MKYQFITNVIQLQLYHYQLCIHQHVIKVVTTTRTYQCTHDMVVNQNKFRKVYFEIKKVACISYLGFFGINNGMEFMFSIFWTF
jgi:hypothetical protein